MAIYNPESLSAEEFINHDEILETLQYAKANKNNIELIDSILEKARPKHYAGRHRCFSLAISPKRSRRYTSVQTKSSFLFTATA